MARDAMKELIKARVQCTDVAVGSLLSRYEKGGLDEMTRGLFTEHLGECLHCMALYNIETKHKYGFIDAKRKRVRRVEVKLRPWLPSPKLAVVALVLWVLVIPFATIRTRYLNPQETGGAVEGESNGKLIARVEPTPSTEDGTGSDGTASTEKPEREQKRTMSNQDNGGGSRQELIVQSPDQAVNLAPPGNEVGKAAEAAKVAVNSNNPDTPPAKPISSDGGDVDPYMCQVEIPPPAPLPPTVQLSDGNRAPNTDWVDDIRSPAMQKLVGACSSGNENGCQ